MEDIQVETVIEIKQAYDGDAGFDLPALEGGVIRSHATKVIDTGVRVALPPGWEGQVRSRSGLAARESLFVLNSPGTVDSGYRNTIKIILHNLGEWSVSYERGDRLAQLVFKRVPSVRLKFVESIDTNTDRGQAGLGSTGVKSG